MALKYNIAITHIWNLWVSYWESAGCEYSPFHMFSFFYCHYSIISSSLLALIPYWSLPLILLSHFLAALLMYIHCKLFQKGIPNQFSPNIPKYHENGSVYFWWKWHLIFFFNSANILFSVSCAVFCDLWCWWGASASVLLPGGPGRWPQAVWRSDQAGHCPEVWAAQLPLLGNWTLELSE